MVPLDSMHTFESEHNKILWKVKLRGYIRMWPDVLNEFEIKVLPVELVGGWQ